MKSFSYVAVLLLALAPLALSAQASKDSANVVATSERYRQAWLEGDTAKALSVVSNDIRIMIQGSPDVRGRAATAALFAEEMAAFKIPSLTINRDELTVRGDRAIDVGTYQETLVPVAPNQATINASGRYVIIWRRERGGWRLLTFMLNSATREFQ